MQAGTSRDTVQALQRRLTLLETSPRVSRVSDLRQSVFALLIEEQCGPSGAVLLPEAEMLDLRPVYDRNTNTIAVLAPSFYHLHQPEHPSLKEPCQGNDVRIYQTYCAQILSIVLFPLGRSPVHSCSSFIHLYTQDTIC